MTMNIYNFTKEELIIYLVNHNFKKYNATQIYEWLYQQSINDFSQITNLSKKLVEHLSSDFIFDQQSIIQHQHDTDVDKFLIKLTTGEQVEAVLMHHNYGNSLCLSTQVGCNMGCAFCASGQYKKTRNITAGEMVATLMLIQKKVDIRISHVVLMGTGEPFDNYEEVLRFITIINDPKGLAIGARHITISTCGIVPKIYLFAEFPLQVNLAISLHAANNQLRNNLMPINRVYPLSMLIEACQFYIKKTNRRITFEYILLSGINDHVEDAKALADLIKGMNAYVNLIPYNQTTKDYQQTSTKNTLNFYDLLKKSKINVTIRKEFGSNIDAACGQLIVRNEETK